MIRFFPLNPILKISGCDWSSDVCSSDLVDYIKSNENHADPFTKALAKDRVWNALRGMGLKSIES